MSMRLARAKYPARFAAYHQWLEDQAYPVGGVVNPMPVRLTDGMDVEEAAQLARIANVRNQMAMSMSEQAMSDTGQMTGDMLPLFGGGNVDGVQNRPFGRSIFQKIVGTSEMGAMISRAGPMSQHAVRRDNAALMANST